MSANSEQAIKIVSKLYDMRTAARSALGNKFESQMRVVGEDIQAIATKENINVLTAATRFAKDKNMTGWPLIILMAAAIELVEPSIEP